LELEMNAVLLLHSHNKRGEKNKLFPKSKKRVKKKFF
jgi:hypothetical protein